MKLIYMLSVGVATVGMTCNLGYASAANTTPGESTSESMLVAQSTSAPGGRGGGSIGEPGRTDKGTPNQMNVERGNSGSAEPGMGTDGTSPEKARPGMGMDTGSGGNTGSNSGRTGANSGSSTEPTGDAGLSGMKGIGSGSSSGAGGGGK